MWFHQRKVDLNSIYLARWQVGNLSFGCYKANQEVNLGSNTGHNWHPICVLHDLEAHARTQPRRPNCPLRTRAVARLQSRGYFLNLATLWQIYDCCSSQFVWGFLPAASRGSARLRGHSADATLTNLTWRTACPRGRCLATSFFLNLCEGRASNGYWINWTSRYDGPGSSPGWCWTFDMSCSGLNFGSSSVDCLWWRSN